METIDAFTKLFRGREDVWGSVEGKSNKEAVTFASYEAHFQGKRSLGVYPLLDDGTCHFFAVDLDEKNFDKALKIRSELNRLGLPVYICESKSKGYHIYGFGSEPLVAKDVRYVLLGMLDLLKISAEVFPKQDRLDETIKYGNYINLPCFGSTRQFQSAKKEAIPAQTALTLVKPISNEQLQKAKELVPPPAPVLVPLKPKEGKGKKEKVVSPPCVERMLKGVESGMRDEAAFALARHYLDQGDVPEEVLARLIVWDARNKPPLADMRILQTKVQSAEHGYAFGCNSIIEGLLSGFCVGKSNCSYFKKDTREKKKEGLIIERTFYENDTYLYEEVATVNRSYEVTGAEFLCYEKATGKITVIKEIAADEKTIWPIISEEIGYRAVILPAGIEEYGDTLKLVESLKAHIIKYTDLPDNFREFAAWYVLMSWVYGRLPGMAYLRFLGDYGCITGDSRVLLARGGQKKIKTLGSQHLEKICVALRIPNQRGPLEAAATRFHIYKDAPVLEISTESGKRLEGTYNHPLLVKRGQFQVWTDLGEIRIGDKVRVVTGIPGPHTTRRSLANCSLDYAGFLGYLIGDGGIKKNGYSATLYIADTECELLPLLIQKIVASFDISPSHRIRKAHGVGRKVDMHLLEINSKRIVSTLPREKRIPEIIWGATKPAVAAFLSWFFTADGSVYQGGRGHSGIALAQAWKNTELLREVQLLLLRFGIHSRIVEMPVTSQLFIRRATSIVKFAKEIGFQTEAKKNKLTELVARTNKLTRRRSPRQPWEKVTSIRDAGKATVYDLEVPEHHRFIANGFVSHNTGKSRSLDVIGGLCYKRMRLGGAITTAPIFRMLKKYEGSLIIDEADFDKSDTTHELVKILNSGIERGTPIMRCTKDDPDITQVFPCFGPKAFATRMRFLDEALESRCLTVVMEESDRADIPSYLAKEHNEAQQHLVAQLLLWRFRNMTRIPEDISEETDIDLGNIESRLKQVCIPFAMIFQDMPETLDRFRRFLQVYSKELRESRMDSIQGRLVMALFKVAASVGKEYVSIGAITKTAQEELKLDIRENTASRILHTMKIATERKRVGLTRGRYIKWENKLMIKLYRRYLNDLTPTPEEGSEEAQYLEMLGFVRG